MASLSSPAMFGEPIQVTSREGTSIMRPDLTMRNGVIHLVEAMRIAPQAQQQFLQEAQQLQASTPRQYGMRY